MDFTVDPVAVVQLESDIGGISTSTDEEFEGALKRLERRHPEVAELLEEG